MISALLFSSLLGANPDVAASLQEVRRAFIEDGEDRVSATPTHRVVSHADGSLELQGAQPLRLSLEAVRRERGPRCLTQALTREVDATSPRTVRTARACGLEETWSNGADGLAHAFTLQRPPEGTGGLTLRVSVEGPWHHQDGDGHVFKGPGAADLLRYGNAFVIREGRRFPVPVVRVDGALELRVPRRLVEAAGAFPMHIDPVLSSPVPIDPGVVEFGPPPGQEETPAIAVNASGVAMVVWADSRRQVGADIFGARFDPAGGLADPVGIPIAVSAGHQSRPTICGQGSAFLIAWESPSFGPDAGTEVRARVYGANGTLTAETVVAQGSQPALAAMGDGGSSVLAWVDNTSTVQVAPMSGTARGSPFPRPNAGTADVAARPAIAATAQSWFVAWESSTQGTTVIKGLASGPAMPAPVALDVMPAATTARRPTVAFGNDANGDQAYVFWEQGSTLIAGALASGGGSVLSLPSFVGASPFAVSTSTASGMKPTLGYFAAGNLHLENLTNGDVRTVPVGPRPNDLALAAGAKLYGAWTEGPLGGSDVMGAVLTTGLSVPRPLVLAQAGNAQRVPHVALKDDGSEGLAVWLDGPRMLRGAKVVADASGLRLGTPFVIANPLQAIEQVDVAGSGNGNLFLVAWRQSGSAITAQLTTTSSKDGAPIPLGILAPGAGPAIAWDEQRSTFMVAWSQVQGLGFDVVSRAVSVGGVATALVTHASGSATDVDLTCLKGECLLAWQRNDDRDIQWLLLGTLEPLHTQAPASFPAVTHDGTNFFLGWRSGNGLSFARVEYGTGTMMTLPGGVATSNGSVIAQLSLAPAKPPVLAWSEINLNDEARVYLQRLDFLEPASPFDGQVANVATAGLKPQGVVVYQRYEPGDGLRVMRAFGTSFGWPFDPGLPDAGVDAGTVDAGAPDAGFDAGMVAADGGVDGGSPDAGMVEFGTSGCGCGASSSAPVLLLALLAAVRRRRR